jgi:superfamily II DNA or RNA helicase
MNSSPFILNFDTFDSSILNFTNLYSDDDLEENQRITVPRSYQMEIFQKAMNSNVIAVLDTGSGKTLIAALLIRHMHNLDDYEGKGKKLSVFLVPKVPLVSQQQKYLSANLNLTVKQYYGEMNVDSVIEFLFSIFFFFFFFFIKKNFLYGIVDYGKMERRTRFCPCSCHDA